MSGLLWSAVPGILADLFRSPADVLATVASGIIAGVATSAVIGLLVARFGRGVAILLGLLSLPLGAFVFGFSLSLIDQLLPASNSGTRALIAPWTLGFNYALLSVIAVFAVGLFPLAVITSLLLRVFMVRGKRAKEAA